MIRPWATCRWSSVASVLADSPVASRTSLNGKATWPRISWFRMKVDSVIVCHFVAKYSKFCIFWQVFRRLFRQSMSPICFLATLAPSQNSPADKHSQDQPPRWTAGRFLCPGSRQCHSRCALHRRTAPDAPSRKRWKKKRTARWFASALGRPGLSHFINGKSLKYCFT